MLFIKSMTSIQYCLIDEYDVPLANASYHDIQNTKLYRDEKDFKADFHYNMVDLMKSFLEYFKRSKDSHQSHYHRMFKGS